jgi:hypothetical protein
MTIRSKIPSLLALSFTIALTDCSIRGGTSYTYLTPTVNISPQVIFIEANGSQAFVATVKNTGSNVIWSVQPNAIPSKAIGSFVPATADGLTGTYFAPSTPPIYSPSQIAAGAVQGSVTLSATVADSPNSNLFTKTSLTFAITGPINVYLSPETATVPLGGVQQFTGFAVGSTNNMLIWEVDGFPGGGIGIGTVTASGLYTAPVSLPMSGNMVTITALSAADGTKSASSAIVLSSPQSAGVDRFPITANKNVY